MKNKENYATFLDLQQPFANLIEDEEIMKLAKFVDDLEFCQGSEKAIIDQASAYQESLILKYKKIDPEKAREVWDALQYFGDIDEDILR